MTNDFILLKASSISSLVFPELTEKQAVSVIMYSLFGRHRASKIMQISDSTLKTHLRRSSDAIERLDNDEWECVFILRLAEILTS